MMRSLMSSRGSLSVPVMNEGFAGEVRIRRVRTAVCCALKFRPAWRRRSNQLLVFLLREPM